MRVQGQLEVAQFENLAADPSDSAFGHVYFNTVALFVKYFDSSVWRTFVETDADQILTFKDYDGGTATNTSRMTLPKNTTSNLQALSRKAGTIVYDTDKTKPYYDNGSVLKPIGSGSGSGGINYDTNPSAEDDLTGYAASGAGVTVTRETTAANLPRESLTPSAVKITCVSGTTDYIYWRFQLGDADKAKQLFASWAQKALSGYAAGDLVFEMWTNTASNYGGTYAQLSVGTPNIPSDDFVYSTVWNSDTSDYYEARWRIASGTGALALCDISLSPQVPVSIPSGEVEYAYNSGTWDAADTTSFAYGEGGATISGALTAGSRNKRVRFKSAILTSDIIELQFSTDGVSWFTAEASSLNGSPISVGVENISGGNYSGTQWNAINSTDISINFYQYQWPNIGGGPTDWTTGFWRVVKRSAQEVFVANNQVEYLFNLDTSTSTNTTSFGYGQGGQQFGAFNSTIAKRVRARTPNLPTDRFSFQLSIDAGVTFHDLECTGNNVTTYTNQLGTEYGVLLSSVNSTDIDVTFAQYRAPSAGAFGAAGQGWAGIAGNPQFLWRVVKCSNPIGIGHDLVGQNKAGLVQAAGQLLASNTDDLAESDKVDYKVESIIPAGSAVSIPSNAATNITSVNLPSGRWRVDGLIIINGTLTGNGWLMSINDQNAVDGTSGDNRIETPTLPTAVSGDSMVLSKDFDIPFGSSANIYLIANVNYSVGSATGFGRITARRR